jgi:mycothiol system anti-sigma-R factor
MTGPEDDRSSDAAAASANNDWEPSETDCREALDRVYTYLDGEIEDLDKTRIREHLDECSPCLRQYGIEQEVKILVARCCGSETASTELRARVLTRIAEVRLEITSVEYRPD